MKKIDDKKNQLLKTTPKEETKALKTKFKHQKRIILIITILINVSFLFFFKYLGFFTTILNGLLDIIRIDYNFEIVKYLAPIGISFYTLQALSYIIDCYNEKIEPESNPFKVMLYLSFFPTIMEGPITRYSEVKDTIFAGEKVSYNTLTSGYQRILIGLFKKYVIADRLNIFVKMTFENYLDYSGITLFLGAVFYTIMLYMEFSGTMDVVIGSAEIFNIKLSENFKQPFLSKNISEFWSRWHITLGTWFKDYIFYPVSLSHPVKKLSTSIRKKFGNRLSSLTMGAIALFAVWSLNGLWHGAGLTFIIFGYYHFILILIENITEPTVNNICQKININRKSKWYQRMQIFKTTILIIFGELIFRANSLTCLLGMLKGIFTNLSITKFTSEIFTLGLDIKDYLIVILALIFIFILNMLREKGVNIREKINSKPLPIRWAIYYTVIIVIIIFGAYGSTYAPVDPIYADF